MANMCCLYPFCRMHTSQPKRTSPFNQAQTKRPQQKAENWEWTTSSCSSLTKKTIGDPYKRTKPLRMNLGLFRQFSVTFYLTWTVPEGCHISWSLKDDETPSSSLRLYLQRKGSWSQVIQTSTNWCYKC